MLLVTSSMLWARFSRWMAMNELQERASTILPRLTIVPGDNNSNHHLYPHPYHPHNHYHLPSQADQVLLLVHSHGSQRVRRVWIVGENIEDPSAVDQEAVLAENQDLGRVESSAGETGPVNIPGW